MSSQNVTVYKQGDLIFREGSTDPVLYEMEYGKVGIYKDYNLSSEQLLGEISEGFFGENGLLEGQARNATAVALEDTGLVKLTADTVKDYFVESPLKLDVILQVMSDRIRKGDRAYVKACEYIDTCLEADKENKPLDPEVVDGINKLINGK